MQRQRGELVPIGDALSELGGPVKAIRDATPQGLKPRPKPSCFAVSQNCVSYGHLWLSKRRRLDAAWTWLEMRKEP